MNEKRVIEIKLEDILPNRFQPRLKFNESAIQELSESIKEHGVIQPIVVRQIADKYEIIAGERRYKASLMAGKSTIPAIVTDLNDIDSAEVALIENVQRQNLTPIEEAISYKKILDMGYLTQDNLASKLGKNQSTVANKLRLLNLEEEVQEALLNGQISERHARSLLKLNGREQVDLLNRIIKERLTVRATDLEVDKILNPDKQVEDIEPPKEEIIEEKTLLDTNNLQKIDFPSQTSNEINNMPLSEIEEKKLNIPTEPIIEIPEEKIDVTQNSNIINNDLEDFTKATISPLPFDDSFDSEDDIKLQHEPLEENKELEPLASPQFDNDLETNSKESANFDNALETNSLEFPSEKKFFNFDLLKDEETKEEPKVEDTPAFDFNFSPFTFSPTPTQKEPVKEEIIEENIESENEQANEIPDEKVIEPIIFEPMQNLNNPSVRYDGIKYDPTKEKVISTSSDIRTVINTIRSCAETVKKFGYNIDVTENSLGNTYQIIFDIHKN